MDFVRRRTKPDKKIIFPFCPSNVSRVLVIGASFLLRQKKVVKLGTAMYDSIESPKMHNLK